MDDVEESDNVGIVHLFEERDLADGSAGNSFVFGFETNFLESDDPTAILEVAGFVDNTVGSYDGLMRIVVSEHND